MNKNEWDLQKILRFPGSYVLVGGTRVASASSYEAAKTLAALARLINLACVARLFRYIFY